MMQSQEEGFVLHWGCVTLVAILVVSAGAVLATLGWRWLWIPAAVVVGLMLLNLVVVLFEDRWRMLTDEDVARGAAESCPDCSHEFDILRRLQSFKLRCPICGRRESGAFHR